MIKLNTNQKIAAAAGVAAFGGYIIWTRRFKLAEKLIDMGLRQRYIPSDDQGHYDIDGVSLYEGKVIVGSSAC